MNATDISKLPYSCSIVITNYNQGHLIADAIDSAIQQTYLNKEIIVVDDGSTDNSVSIINEKIKGIPNVRLITKLNGGTASARNAGVKESKSHIIAFLDADDVYYPDKVAISIGKLMELPGLGVAYTDYNMVNTTTGNMRREFKMSFDFNKLLQICIVSSNSIVKREVFDAIGYFNENIRGMEDYEFWLRAGTRFAFCHIPFALFLYREHGGNKTLTTNRDDWLKEEQKMKQDFMVKWQQGKI